MITSFKIYNRFYYLRTTNPRSPELEIKGSFCYGVHNFSTSEIIIDNSLNDDLFVETVRHELSHAIFDFTCHNAENYTEEQICELIGMHGGTISDIANDLLNEWKRYNGRGE